MIRFLCDVHISYKIVNYLKSAGYEVLHINTILDKWYTKDKDISEYADKNDFVIVTKDTDFRDSYHVKKIPKKLIKVNLENISNSDLIQVFSEIIRSIEKLEHLSHFLIEVDKDCITYFTEDEAGATS